jgi:hypothetical protein
MNTPAPNRDHALLAAFIGALITVFFTIVLFFISFTATGHGHDYDTKQQLVESISTAAANAVSAAQDIGSGSLVNEATSSIPPAAVVVRSIVAE